MDEEKKIDDAPVAEETELKDEELGKVAGGFTIVQPPAPHG